MPYGIFADIVVLIHLAFVIFAVLGAVLAIWWRWTIWLHLPAFLWAVWIEYTGGICPLTPLENWLRIKGGQGAYAGDFVATYLLPVLYPAGLTRNVQFILAMMVIVINVVIYGSIIYKRSWKKT
ncbi:putative membrane protein [Olavius sp. associated proteobacterium Delta 1]|nr:putative membrane protein [Olavius sp. associated proteobacterium Delta 1]